MKLVNKTKIDWCDSTWNPVTGCLHGCEYCYARSIANRFGHSEAFMKMDILFAEEFGTPIDDNIHDLEAPATMGKRIAYPYNFEPTFHRYRLNDYKSKKARTIFVCSMADLFGEWVPDEWIQEVFKACEVAPQHRYLFLTKNPKRYCDLANTNRLPRNRNFWYGTTITKREDAIFPGGVRYNTFISIEPLLEPLDVGIGSFGGARWVIVGAETGKRKDKVIPKREWVENIVNDGAIIAKVFMKESLRELMGEDFIQEYPWEVQ